MKIAPYQGSETPIADKCDQAAQANGNVSQRQRPQRWYCIQSAKGSVVALRVDTANNEAIDGHAIVWRR